MAGAAYSNGNSQVQCSDGAKGTPCSFDGKGNPIAWHWDSDTTQVTDAGSSDVFINGIPAIREGDAMHSHPDEVPCTSSPIDHSPTLSTFSATVKVNGKGMGRIGDKFNSDGHGDHTIITGSGNVNVG